MQNEECTRCGASCEAEILRPCDRCSDGAQAYYWPCKACGYTINGSQCENKENCVGAIEYRRANG